MSVYSLNRTALNEESSFNRKYVSNDHIMDFVVENTQNELNMFNAVIGLDFLQAYTEADEPLRIEDKSGDTEAASNATKEGIGSKIKAMFTKLIESIKKFFSTAIVKIKNFVNNDKKLVSKYINDFHKNSKGVVVKNVKIPKTANPQDVFKNRADKSLVVEFINKVDKATNESELKEFIDNENDGAKAKFSREGISKQVMGAMFLNGGEAVKEYKIGDAVNGDSFNAGVIETIMKSSSNFVSAIKSLGDLLLSDAKASQGYIIKPYKSDNKLEVSKYNTKFKIATLYCNYISAYSSAAVNAAMHALAGARKIFISGAKGSTSAEASTEEKNKAQAEAFILGELSDIYCEEAFSFI